jgi:hypothetical protein
MDFRIERTQHAAKSPAPAEGDAARPGKAGRFRARAVHRTRRGHRRLNTDIPGYVGRNFNVASRIVRAHIRYNITYHIMVKAKRETGLPSTHVQAG